MVGSDVVVACTAVSVITLVVVCRLLWKNICSAPKRTDLCPFRRFLPKNPEIWLDGKQVYVLDLGGELVAGDKLVLRRFPHYLRARAPTWAICRERIGENSTITYQSLVGLPKFKLWEIPPIIVKGCDGQSSLKSLLKPDWHITKSKSLDKYDDDRYNDCCPYDTEPECGDDEWNVTIIEIPSEFIPKKN